MLPVVSCGLCVSTCPSEAIKLIRKEPEELALPPMNEMAWHEERALERGIDFSAYKQSGLRSPIYFVYDI